jgi:hypothetical protein
MRLYHSNGLDMRAEIRRERNIELYLEVFRFDDLKRLETAEVAMPILGVKWLDTKWERWKVTGNAPYALDADGVLIFESGRKWDQKKYLYPVPTQQIELNPNLAPNNPGWQ